MTLRITIACPEAMMADANQFALCVGSSAADVQTFKRAGWENQTGARFALASLLAGDDFPVAASSVLQTPAHAPMADIDAAARAQSKLAIWSPLMSDTPPVLNQDTLLAIVGVEPGSAIPLLHLAPIPIEE
ncbi:hypothetical protein ALP8811_02707 [Aliiroseovarius pelagivivens]|uniref:Uncharacterized protein n=1 Tax=Aliiroseovarius pelagivivens TaxID=1639690 RepID=A0A2R8ARX6_9RHOB|nr:hypothetical protein [Aliiroseovarius pelagivivens]SPF78775.1 hypothetical protein ALP8811_02707 [Aliiroseovarius pelagivivens]